MTLSMDDLAKNFKNKNKKKSKVSSKTQVQSWMRAATVDDEKTKEEFIYCLAVKNLENSIIYVGRTKQTLNKRLQQHISESVKGTSEKCKGIRDIIKAGYDIEILLLDTIKMLNNDFTQKTEQAWVWIIEATGVKLLNSKEGDVDNGVLYQHNKNFVRKDLTPDDFKSCNWVKGGKEGKSNEWYTKLNNGYEFYRTGWSKLRWMMKGQSFETRGMDWDICVSNACKYFTKEHEYRKRMFESIARNK